MTQPSRSMQWLVGLLAAAMLAGPVWASDPYSRSYENTDARAGAAQIVLDRDQADLEAARRRVDDISSARDRQMRDLAKLRDIHTDLVDRTVAAPPEAAVSADRIKALQQEADAARAKVDRLHEAALAKFESTDEFKADYAVFDQARKELKEPTDAVLERVAQTREFQELVAAARAAKAREEQLKTDKSADAAALKAAEQVFLDADNKVQDAEEKALLADGRVVSGRQKVDAAQAILRGKRDRMEEELRKDPAFAAALAESHRQDQAVETAVADQKNTDAAAGAHRSTGQGSDAATEQREVIRDAETKLDAINRDLEAASAEMSKLEARVIEDREDVRYARQDRQIVEPPVVESRPYDTQSPVEEVSPPAYYPPVRVESVPVYPAPYYEPPVRYYSSYYYSSYYYSSGIYLGFGYSTYRDRHGYGDRYYGRSYDRDDDRRSWRSEGGREFRDTSDRRSDRDTYSRRSEGRTDSTSGVRSRDEGRRQGRSEDVSRPSRTAVEAPRSETRGARHSSSIVESTPVPRQSSRSASPPSREPSRPARVERSAPEISSRGRDSRPSHPPTDSTQGAAHGHGH